MAATASRSPLSADLLSRLAKLARFGVLAAQTRHGPWHAVQNGDLRRRKLAIFTDAEIRSLLSAGAMEIAHHTGIPGAPSHDGEPQTSHGRTCKLSEAGFALLRREISGDYRFQHRGVRRRPGIAHTEGEGPALMIAGSAWRFGVENGMVDPQNATGSATASALKASGPHSPLSGSLAPALGAASDRLARDEAMGSMGPRVTMDWSGIPASRQRLGPGQNPAERSMLAVDARRRVEAAFEAIGPELSPIIRAFAIEGLGLASLERRFAWPPRTARIVLVLGLERLAAHYAASDGERG